MTSPIEASPPKAVERPRRSVGSFDEATTVAAAAGTWVGAVLAPSSLGPRWVLIAGLAVMAGGLRSWLRLEGPASGDPAAREGDGAARTGQGATADLARLVVVVVAVGAGAVMIGGHLGVRAGSAYRPLPPGPWRGAATVVGDPEPIGVAGWRVELRLDGGHRIEARAYGAAADPLHRLGFGVPVEIDATLQPVDGRPWLRARHIVARATLTSIKPIGPPIAPIRVVEAVRERIAAGGRVLDRGPLYDGLVLGDDRFQSGGRELRFRLSGLTHLLAVSGQNVAFVLAATEPLLRRLGARRRLAAVTVTLALFAVVTRMEPSVLRAVTTAALSTWALIDGRARSGLGVLAAAVTALIWVDPFLVDAVGFQLSVAASAGILLLGPLLTARAPGPRWLAQALATSLAAQLAVAPILHHHFGPPPLVAIPANLAAGWAAGAIMTWGLTVGVVAGLLPAGPAAVVQWPVGWLLWWLDTVATVGARLPGPRAGPGTLVALVVLTGLARARPAGWIRPAVALTAAAVVVAATPRPPASPGPCGRGIIWYPAGPDLRPELVADPVSRQRSVLVVGPDAGLDAVEACRLASIRRVDLVVVTQGDRRSAATVAALGEVVAVGRLVAPPQHAVVGATRLREPVAVAGLELRPGPTGRRILVDAVDRPP